MAETIENIAGLATYLGLPTVDSLGLHMSDETLLRDVQAHIAIIKAPMEGYAEAIRQGAGSDRITGVYIGAAVDAAAPRPVEPRELFFPFKAYAWDNAWMDIDFEWDYLMLFVDTDN